MDEHIYTRLKVSEAHGVKLCLFDKEGADLYDRYTWSILKGKTTYYLVRRGLNDVRIYFHRDLMNLQDGEIRDHHSGNGLDNRVINLRPATYQENAWNQRTRSNNTSGVKGVHWSNKNNRWEAQISIDGKQKYLGSFKDKIEAERVVRAKREELHGAFANHGTLV